MGTLMLLGGSNCQLSAVRMAKAMGHKVILVDYLKHPPAADLCDVHVHASTFDHEACISAAKQYGIDGVFTIGTDQPVYTAALVARALHLPSHISVETALAATNKLVMKEAFLKAGVRHVPYVLLKRGQGMEVLNPLVSPYVLKPLDSQGQRGIFKLDSAEEVSEHLDNTLSFSRMDTALAESFYPSDEVTCSCFVHHGHVYPLTITDRQLCFDPVHIGVCAAHRYPSIHADREAEINAISVQVAGALGVTEGPLYIQLLVGRQGILVNEAACRIGGAYEDVFIPRITGFDILQAVILMALNREPDVSALISPPPRPARLQVSVQMLFCRPGLIASVTPLEQLLAQNGVLTAGYNYAPGSTLKAMENATERFGYCVLYSDAGDVQEKVQALYRLLKVADSEGNNLVIARTYDGKET